MRLEAVTSLFDGSRFPALGERAHPERATVLAARTEIGRAVLDDKFLADCIGLEIERLVARDSPRPGLQPFFTHPVTGVSLAFGYWAPGAVAEPHEHTAWTVTAVCRNQLEILTFDRSESYRLGELVSKNRFEAQAGAVGYIYEPCIHAPQNASGGWSLSLHAISPRDGEPAGPGGPPPWHARPANPRAHEEVPPYASVLRLRRRLDAVSFLAEVLAGMSTSAAERPLQSAFRIAPARVAAVTLRSPFPGVAEDGHRFDGFERAHPGLGIEARLDGPTSSLYVETSRGERAELSMSAVAHDALCFVAASQSFDVAALPGVLTDEERLAIGNALEESGLFKRVFRA